MARTIAAEWAGMSFRIEFVRRALRHEAPDDYMVGRASLSEGEISFLSSTEQVPTDWYERQWRSALTALADEEALSVVLWTDVPLDPAVDFGTVLALYADDSGLVKVREQLVFPGSTRARDDDLDRLAYETPKFAEFNDDGLRISTWHTSLSEIAEFLA